MDNNTIRQNIFELKKQIVAISDELDKLAGQIPSNEKKHCDLTFRAPYIIKKAREQFALGLSTWEVAENLSCFFGGSSWDAFYFISSEKSKKIAQKRYATAYLIRCLSDHGFSKEKISKLAGLTPQRCGQILKKNIV